ncbi:hypothetical protein CEXT_329801 [Caerostris extrusa]|uniref:Uncharacterized protein n=1 Tax=Caerostris extrusa TaxID=172846 RepID=A0AAV4MPJ9_CAEEX|nr:hypothetical protein CEXT_329801 [Caerostris extrusa]
MFQNSLQPLRAFSKEIVHQLCVMPFSSIFVIDGVASVAAVAMTRVLNNSGKLNLSAIIIHGQIAVHNAAYHTRGFPRKAHSMDSADNHEHRSELLKMSRDISQRETMAGNDSSIHCSA